MTTYEAMFLFDPTFASDFTRVEQEVGRIIERAAGQIVVSKKWDERKLAYEIKGRKRGCYVLTFFRAPKDGIAGIERDVQLSESILRVLIFNADHMTEEDMQAAYGARAEPAEEKRGGPVDGGAGRAAPDAQDDTTAERTSPGHAKPEVVPADRQEPSPLPSTTTEPVAEDPAEPVD